MYSQLPCKRDEKSIQDILFFEDTLFFRHSIPTSHGVNLHQGLNANKTQTETSLSTYTSPLILTQISPSYIFPRPIIFSTKQTNKKLFAVLQLSNDYSWFYVFLLSSCWHLLLGRTAHRLHPSFFFCKKYSLSMFSCYFFIIILFH